MRLFGLRDSVQRSLSAGRQVLGGFAAKNVFSVFEKAFPGSTCLCERVRHPIVVRPNSRYTLHSCCSVRQFDLFETFARLFDFSISLFLEGETKPMKRQLLLATSAVAAASMVLTSVTPTLAATGAADAPKVLRVNTGAYPDTIDPQKSSFVNEIAHLKLIYEGLTRLSNKLETVPAAAEKWDVSKDGKVYTFTLRSGLKYSDGSPLNAKRFEYSVIRNINPQTAGEYGTITNEVLGAPEWQDKFAAIASAKNDAAKKTATDAAAKAEATVRTSVRALGKDGKPCADYAADCPTLVMKLSKPAPYWPTIMALWVMFPAKEENISAGKDQWYNSSKFQIGNGPYVLKALEPFVRARFTPNKNYWAGVAKTDIEYAYIVDSAVATLAYKNNEFDVVGLPAEDLAATKADPELSKQATIYPGSCTFALEFRNFKKPFDDPKVRAAFSYAIDRDRWVKDVLKGLGASTMTWIPPGYPGFKQGESAFKYDADAAMKAIAASTYKSVDKLPPIVLSFGDTPRNRTRFEWLGARFKEVFGDSLKLDLKPVEPTAYTAMQKDKNSALQMFIGGWCADYPDPQNWLSVYFNGNSTFAQRFGYNSKAFNALTDSADKELDLKKRADLYQQAQDQLVKDNPIAFMYNSVNSYMVKPWVNGFVTTSQDGVFPGDTNPLTLDIDTSKLPK